MSSSSHLFDGRAAPAGRERRYAPQAVHAPWGLFLAAALALLFVGLQAWLQSGWLLSGPNNDFFELYAASPAAPYEPSGSPAAANGRAYLRLPFHAALAAPLRLLPYASAYLLWQVLMAWCIAGFVAWWRPPSGAVVLGCLAVSLPLFFVFIHGQDHPVALLAAAGCVHAAALGRPFRAGLWLSLLAIQPQLLVAAPLALAAQGRWTAQVRWTALKGLAAGVAGMLAVCFAVAGPDWPLRYASAWRASAPATAEGMPNLLGAAAWLGLGEWAVYPAGALALAAVYGVSRRGSLPASLGCALAAGLLLWPRARFEDAVLLLPAALTLLVEARSPMLRLVAAVALCPVVYLLQGGREAVPAAVLLGMAMVLLAGAPPVRSWPLRGLARNC